MRTIIPHIKFGLAITTALILSSCIASQSPPSQVVTVPAIKAPTAQPKASAPPLTKTIMLCNLNMNGKMTIYQFNGVRVNSGTLSQIRFPNGLRTIFRPGSEPRFQYSVTSQSNRTAMLTLYLTDDQGAALTQKVALKFDPDSSYTGSANIKYYQNNKIVKTARATFFVNSHEAYD